MQPYEKKVLLKRPDTLTPAEIWHLAQRRYANIHMQRAYEKGVEDVLEMLGYEKAPE